MTSPQGAAPTRRKAKMPLWTLRSRIPESSGRLLALCSLALVFVTWSIVSYVTLGPDHQPLVSHFFLPPPHEVLRSLIYLVIERDLLGAVATSTWRILLAFGLAVVVALPLGIFMGSFEAVNRFFDPVTAPMRYLPITAFIPLLILWFGIDEKQKIAFLFLGTFVYLLPVVVDAIRAVPEELVHTAFTLGASKRQAIWTVLIPAALPQIFDSFRVMNAIAWTYIILAEIVNAQNGIGYILRLAEQHTKPAWSFAGILVVGVIGIATDLLIRGINSLLFRWREADA